MNIYTILSAKRNKLLAEHILADLAGGLIKEAGNRDEYVRKIGIKLDTPAFYDNLGGCL